jgi:hypothetical protein
MTMWLTYPIMAKLRPVPDKPGWFELASRPYRPGYHEAYEFAGDYEEDIIKGAKIVGWHSDHRLLEDDPRFNWEEESAWESYSEDPDGGAEPSLVVANTPDGPVMVFMCNRPEGMLFEYMLDEDEGPEDPEMHFPSYRADSEERYQEYCKKEEAERAKRVKEKLAALKAEGAKKPAASIKKKKATAKA